jgi:hypothetical protein
MKSIVVWLTLAVVLLLIDHSLAAFDSRSKSQMLDNKAGYSRKKQTDKGHDMYSRYQDWDEDWADEDMMQHPIDEAPRKVRSVCMCKTMATNTTLVAPGSFAGWSSWRRNVLVLPGLHLRLLSARPRHQDPIVSEEGDSRRKVHRSSSQRRFVRRRLSLRNWRR